MRQLLLPSLLALAIVAGIGGAAQAQAPFPAPSLACSAELGENCEVVELAQSNCAAAAARVAQQMGGKVIGAPQAIQQGERTMCVVTVLVRDPSGQRPPRRERVVVPAG